ncbi:PREDICTED: transcription factor MYB1R1 [Theobroma cacao]|uniref:Transcription factor MYB1R1 n=1 Tax=Theobroma cacao TaxID=3641 RepID=A0AB32VDF7_THECC|nr:PREDICTED: transcription factor MYB1R1 [Theobroma cacao]
MPASTCASASSSTANSTANGGSGGGGEIMLFGVRVVVDSMRKSVSMNNLSQYEQPHASNSNNKINEKSNNNNNNKGDDNVTAGYASADDAVPQSTGNRERKRGVPWTEEEHKLFLLGLQKVGKGDWRGISRNFVKTRTPTQVASHAQKYFLRRNNLNRRRRRSSLFDITTDTVAAVPMEEEQVHPQGNTTQPSEINGFPMMPTAFPMTVNPPVPMENLTLGQGNRSDNNATAKLIRPVPISPAPLASDLNLNLNSVVGPSPLSLKLSLQPEQKDSSSRHSAFQVMPSFSNGDSNSIISVA